jgi:hypothetical protein
MESWTHVISFSGLMEFIAKIPPHGLSSGAPVTTSGAYICSIGHPKLFEQGHKITEVT